MDSATTTEAPALAVDFDLLIAARHELDRVKNALSSSWYRSEAHEAYNLGRCVEACDAAFASLSNVLITLSVFGNVAGGPEAVNRMNDRLGEEPQS